MTDKDFYDLYTLGSTMSFEGGSLSRAIGATFQLRETFFPGTVPLALSPDFADLPQKGLQWRAFLKNNRLAAPQALGEIIAPLAMFLWPPLESQGRGSAFEMNWAPGGPWKGP